MAAKLANEDGRDAQKEAHRRAARGRPHSDSTAVLAIAVLGIVYGDIGTSPALRDARVLRGHDRSPITPDNVLGILSLIFWSLMLVVSLKYMVFVLRADNRGEGGTLALLALLRPQARSQSRRGAAHADPARASSAPSLLYGDGMITPAISVLSAVEGLEVADARAARRS